MFGPPVYLFENPLAGSDTAPTGAWAALAVPSNGGVPGRQSVAGSISAPTHDGRRFFCCPLCIGRCYISLQPLQNHVDKFHLTADEEMPALFLTTHNRRVCPLYKVLAPSNGNCRRCRGGPLSKRPRPDAANLDDTATDPTLWENPPYLPKRTLRFVPHGVLGAWCALLSA